jgi:flagellar motility protein MotE (MotC chaperone)
MNLSDTALEEDLVRLTAIYEGMKSKDAASLFAAMAPDFAAGFLGRMKPGAAAAILSGLPPDAAYALSAHMAGRSTGAMRFGQGAGE